MSKNSKKKEVALRSSAAEYLTFVASTGESDESFEVREYLADAEDDGYIVRCVKTGYFTTYSANL